MVRLSAACALAALLSFSEVSALSAHSPTDLFAHPQFKVVLKEEILSNESVSEQLTKPRSSSDPTIHRLNTPSGQSFLCSVPKSAPEPEPSAQPHLSAAELAAESERGLSNGLALLAPMSGHCLFLRPGGGWFTYSFCYGQAIRQFHALGLSNSEPIEDGHHQSFVLGNAPAPVPVPVNPTPAPDTPPESSLVRAAKAGKRIPATLGGSGVKSGLGINEGGKYISQIYEDGSVCDMTGLKRKTEVQFHCSTQSVDRIVIIRETAICVYSVVIHTPRLCSDPVFLDSSDRSSAPPNEIECRPIVNNRGGAPPPLIAPSHTGAATPVADPIPAAAPTPEQIKPDLKPAPGVAAAPEPAQNPFADDPLAGDVHRTEDGWYDEGPEMVTVIYDHETGEIQQAYTDEGEDVTHEFDSYGPIQPGQAGAKPVDKSTVDDLERRAKAMQQQIADALRPQAEGGPEAVQALDPRDFFELIGVDPQQAEELSAAIHRTFDGEGGAERLDAYLAPAAAEERRETEQQQPPQPPPPAADDSEHSKLKQAFAKKYETPQEEDAASDERRRDEL